MNKTEEKHSSGGALIRSQRAVLEIADKIYPIYDGLNTVGRNPNAVINIKNITVSQQHAIIVVVEEDKHFISDLKSSNGTFLNYNGLQPLILYELNDNDLIRFGDLNAIYKKRSNETNPDSRQIECAASQSMSQSFYMTNTQNLEVDHDFHEMDTEVFNTDNELASFHDLPTQVECFDVHVNHDDATNDNSDENAIDLPLNDNMQIDALELSEDLYKNTNATNQRSDQEQINENNENVENLLPIVENNDDTSNDSMVLASKNIFDEEMRNQQMDKIDEQTISNSVTDEPMKVDVSNEQSNENNDESSNESLDLVTMSKVAQSPCKFDDNLEQSQQIKPVILANSLRRISDSDNSELMENVKEQTIPNCNSDDETDIENAGDNDDVENESSSAQTAKKNRTVNELDLIPATPDVDLQEPQGSGVIDDSFEDSSFALDISDKVFESSDSNRADEETIQATQQLNISVVVKHKNYNNIDGLYLESTQKIENNSNIINEQPQKTVDNGVDEVKNGACKENSSDNDLFALPGTPKKSKHSKLIIDPKSSSTPKDVEDELQHLFATQQEKFTCSQLVNILADSPVKQNKISDNNNNNNIRKVCDIQSTVIEKSVPATTAVDQNVEQELETIFQTQQDLTCSQLVRILDEPKDVKNSTPASLIRNGPVENCAESTNSKEIQELNNTASKHTKTLQRKLFKFASDKEMEISKSCHVNEEETKQNRTTNSRKRSISPNTASQSSITSVSNESPITTTTTASAAVKVGKETPERKLKKIANPEPDPQIENKNRRVTRSSQSSIGNTSSSEEFFDTSKTKRKKVSSRSNSNEKIEIVESTKNNNRRKRSATAEDVANKSAKIRLNQNANSPNKEVLENAQTSGFPTDTSGSESTDTSITNQTNQMSRRTRKNLSKSTLLLPITVTVPKKEENLENEQKVSRFTRGQSSKKHIEKISVSSDASPQPSSSPSTKTANIKKGKRRLSANSRSMKNLEKIEEQNENETGQKDQSKKNNGRKKSNLQENINQELNQSETIITPERTHRILKPKVVFTMMNSPELESVVRQLGGRVVDNTNACTVLVTEHVKRSAKLLSAVGQGKPICSPQWLLDSKKASHFLDPWDYILKDNEAEEKWNFKLHESLERSNRNKLMENYTFQLFVNEAADVLKGAIESCGGKCVAKYPSKNAGPNFVIVANPENQSKYNRIVKQKPDIRVVAPEAIFDGTLRQELQFERHLLL